MEGLVHLYIEVIEIPLDVQALYGLKDLNCTVQVAGVKEMLALEFERCGLVRLDREYLVIQGCRAATITELILLRLGGP